MVHWIAYGPLQKSLVIRLASVTGMNFVICSYGKFQPGDEDEIQETQPNLVERKLDSFTAVVALWILVTLLIRLICILLNRNYTQVKNHAISAAILSVHMGKFSSQLPRSRSQKSEIDR